MVLRNSQRHTAGKRTSAKVPDEVQGQIIKRSNGRLNKNLMSVACRKNPGFGQVFYESARMCLFWSNDTKTFADAKADCEAKGARLGVFQGADKMALLTSQLKTWSSDIWIGLDDIQNEGTFVWHDGTVLDKKDYYPLYFDKVNPDDFENNQDCVQFWQAGGKLDDDSCSKSKNYVCEK
ncbi:CD209 antigen-like [Biomphalaria glabrata]|uniref:CD209 antigen-like n=1 Tax=Biomphalaria glabrata TaxID=6526 RepID=A0A9W3A168_BIOGL|nr:CD209 antigen-like [Biomphalaria glabrata]